MELLKQAEEELEKDNLRQVRGFGKYFN